MLMNKINLKNVERIEKQKKKPAAPAIPRRSTIPGTKLARRCLTSVFRWEPVHSTWYGRRH